MNTHTLKLTIILFILAGSLACTKNNDDIDMSKIDFSNIEDLYSQPLPVIQQCVQGKWKWYVSCGGDAGIVYPENTFVEITDKEYILDNNIDDIHTRTYFWKKKQVQTYNDKLIETYIMCFDESVDGGRYFSTIKNDTISYYSYPNSLLSFGLWVRVKENNANNEK
jgi:hypothetical protein